MPHGLRSSTVPLIASSRTTKSVTKPTWYTRLQAEQAVGAREVGAKRTETLSGVSVGFASRAASRLGYAATEKRNVARDRIELPTRGFSVLLPYRDYVYLSVTIGIYS